MKSKIGVGLAFLAAVVTVIAIKIGMDMESFSKRNIKAEKDVYWAELSGLNYVSGEATKELKSIDGKVIRIPGFIVPLSDDIQKIDEFLLVPNGMACIHAPPPPPNQMVYVKLDYEIEPEMTYGPVWVTGKLNIDTWESPYGQVGYQMEGYLASPYRN